MKNLINRIAPFIKGEISISEIDRIIYSTDASAYREKPLGVVYPKDAEDLSQIIKFAAENNLSLIPRAAGTSLAGQVVGNGIIVDISKHFTSILEINKDEHWVRVQPGVILDELNLSVKEEGLFFGPETSTANRCMIGGMIGNNSCGSHSIVYGSTRDHLLEVKMLLADGAEVHFKPISKTEFDKKLELKGLEGDIYRKVFAILSSEENRKELREQYPEPSLKRRNSGYALDLLMDNEIFCDSSEKINICSIIAGSEGTLGLITEAKLNLVPLPPSEKAVICIHLDKLEEAFLANLIALKYGPTAVELMDKNILDLTRDNIEQNRNRFFIEGEPAAILIVEFAESAKDDVVTKYEAIVAELKQHGYGYHFPIIWGNDITRVWNLRKAGLGILSNMKGDGKPVSVIEDTAVAPERLPEYMEDFKKVLDKYGLDCVYHAHIGSGELHLRPILNLKDPKDVKLFREIATDVAHLVKKHRGSLSGEHGDGRLRGEFIPIMVGERCYQMMKEIKKTFDSQNIFNPNKIVDTPSMNTHLRYPIGVKEKVFDTIFDYSDSDGLLRAIERCNGSGDCRKTILAGGTMCPSYMATKDEGKTTRARANMLREILTHSSKPFESRELYEVLDLCLSCKGCKSECPSNVDMAKLKAEFLQHYYDANGIPLRSRLVAYITYIYKVGSIVPSITNFVMGTKAIAKPIQRMLGFSDKRTLPLLYKTTLRSWFRSTNLSNPNKKGKVIFFNDEFTNYNDVEVGIKAILLLQHLEYEVIIPNHYESGRTFISKGLIRTAKLIANRNIELLSPLVNEWTPLVGIEPSALLSFRDEYPDLSLPENREKSKNLARNAFLIDEFLMHEMQKGNIVKEQFTDEAYEIHFHGHCQQKSIATTVATKFVLSFPVNYKVQELKTGCCGMAGSFGYEKEHYNLSMAIGELVLFPAVRKAAANVVIAAPGTSCRHHIKDGTGRSAVHPIEVLYEALKK
ncbi:FAD-linked oxidase C-terminal domain-containing protein [uncultured Acetobacteroides sp.]|uniref:FAD-binding and (Fe-S)-binding domain-containing protein n=1 Tax=uncultured Acetobacteroides sp. TaxID=1760811 RepID=UPI0029F4E347|nr:FAD-linked oxidase C-terminal domain-containing protein [uncultured Acetobacteroides sp.]